MDERIRHHYDKEADVLYVSFADDEPAYTKSIEDFLLLDIGWFSGLPKGFRILSPRAHNIKQINVVDLVTKQIKHVMKDRLKALKKEESEFDHIIRQELPELLATEA